MTKFIFVTGGVLSSLGKGTLVASISKILKNAGISVSAMKIDPYLNCDAGTLNPYEHGEVFVTRDGFECDLDLGNYERFLDIFATKEQNLMMGSVYKSVVEKERRGEFLGTTVQLIPHATNEVKSRIRNAAKVTGCDVLVIEIGGTVGDIESDVVLEAARQMRFENGSSPSVLFIHLALVPRITTNEQKTKPMQHSVKALLSKGITPDLLVARSDSMINDGTKKKIALMCNVLADSVFCSHNLDNVYHLPRLLQEQGLLENISKKLELKTKKAGKDPWDPLLEKWENSKEERRIAVVGKYAQTTKDTYMSVFEALRHAAIHAGIKAKFDLINSEDVEKNLVDLNAYDGFLIPGGYGARGTEGKISVIKHARENKIPLLGICYGLQLSVIEIARNLCNLKDANSTEINPQTKYPVIDMLPEQKTIEDKGGTMRLGAYDVALKKGTKAHDLYKNEMKNDQVFKRFRHRYEVNPEYVSQLEKAGIVFSGKDPGREIMKIIEFPNHPFLMGCQYHPEFDSRLEKPEPLYLAFMKATL
ncbi:CTP synthase [Candidatus Micrarchaeota archaeon]|nr:CTP synthase [Candidatus Micrarchaeota archaeon]